MVIADLLEYHDLAIYCRNLRCRRGVQMTRAEAIERFGGGIPIATIRKRAKCTACGAVGAETIVQYVGKTGAV